MSHSQSSKKARTSSSPSLPTALADALASVKKSALDLDAWDALNEVCRQLDRPDETVSLYTEALAGKLTDEVLAGDDLENVGRAAADFCEEWYEETEPVLKMLSRVIEIDPGQKWAFDRITVLLTASARWDELLSRYDVALSVAKSDEERQSLYEEAVKIARDFAAQHERASDYLKELLLLRLNDEQLAAATERRFDEQNRHEDLIAIWTARLPVLDSSSALRTRLQIAARYFERLHDSIQALVSIDEFLNAEGEEASACELLERIADEQSAEISARRSALVRLDQLHSVQQRWPEVISVAERALLLAQSAEECVILHRKLLALYADSSNWDLALRHCADLLKIDATAEDVRVQARSIAQQIGQMHRFADAMVAAAASAEAGERRVELLVEAADVRHSVLDDVFGATQLYFQIESDAAATNAIKLHACQRLGDLLNRAQRQAELLTILERWADLEIETEERRRILGLAAHLALDLGEPERALGLWELCLSDASDDDEALTRRIDILTDLARHADLVVALTARAIVGDNESRKKRDLIQSAEVYAYKLANLDAAIEVWQTIEERFGRDDQTVDALVGLLGEAKRYEEVVSLLDDAISGELDALRVVGQLALLGDTLRIHLDRFADALKAYGRALKIDQTCVPARAGLTFLLEQVDLAYEASEFLVQAFRAAGDQQLIVEISELRLGVAPSAELKSQVLIEVAQIHEHSHEHSAALSDMRRAFALLPSSTIESEIHRLAQHTGEWVVACLAYADAISGCDDPARLTELHISRGRVEQSYLDDPASAATSYRLALELSPERSDVANLLVQAAHRAGRFSDAAWAVVENSRANDRVDAELLNVFAACCNQHGDWDGALEGMADRIAGAESLSAPVAHNIKKQLATWYRDQLDDPDSAELVLKRAVADFPQEDSLRMLAELQRRAPGRPLVATLCALAELASDDMMVLYEAGEVALHAVKDAGLARPILEKALEGSARAFSETGLTPESRALAEICSWATDNLVRLALIDRNYEQAVALLKATADLPFDEQEQIARLFSAAEVAAGGELDKETVALCERILSRAPYHEGAITLLSSLHEKIGRLDELLALRKRELVLDRPIERRLFLRLDQSRVIGILSGETSDRLLVLRENLVDQPGHQETIEALSEILVQENEFASLVALLEEQAEVLSVSAPERAALLWRRAGELSFSELSDQARLIAAFKRAAAASPSRTVVDRLAAIAHEQSKWEEEVSWLSLSLSLTAQVTQQDANPDDRRAIVVSLGRALIKTEELASASRLLQVELEMDPAADEERKLLAELYREQSQWHELSELLELGVAYAPDEQTKVSYLREAASVHRKQLGDVESAIPLLEVAISLDQTDRGLKLMLADTLRICGQNEEAREILQQMLEEFGRRRTSERAMVHVQLARIAEAVGDIDEAVEQADAASKIERSDAGVLMLVGQLARQKGALDRAEQAYRTLALIMGRRSAEAQQVGEVGESTVLFELYRIAAEKGDEQQARELLDSAIDVASRNENEALLLGKALADTEQLELLLSALQLGIDGGLRGEPGARILLTKANVLDQADRSEEAFAVRLAAMTMDPADLRLLDTTQKLAERLDLEGDFWAHVSFLAEQASGNSQVAGELWFRAGQSAQEKGELARAADFYERAQRSGHKPRRTFQALDSVLDEAVEPERVRQALRTFSSSPGADINATVFANALYRLAAMELSGSSFDEATTHMARALELDPQAERVMLMLEPFARNGSASQTMLDLFLSVCKRAAPEPLLLLAYMNVASSPSATPVIVAEATTLARKLGAERELRQLLSRAIELGADHGAEIVELVVERAQMAKADQAYELEAKLLKQALPWLADEHAFDLKLRLATCLISELKLLEEGRPILEELFGSTPTDGRVWRPLLALYRSTGDTTRVEEVIELISDDVTDESDLEALKLERVHLMIGDGRSEEAERELRAVLSVHPQMADAATLLAQILKNEGRWDELRSVMSTLLEQARSRHDEHLVAQYALELAQLIAPADREEAINVLVADLSLTKGKRELLSYLLSLYNDEDNQSERADVMEYFIAVSTSDEARILALDLVRLRTALDDQFGVGRALELGVRAAPADVELAELLLAHLRNTGEYGALADALLIRAEQLTGADAVAHYAEAGAIYDTYLGEPTKAAGAFEMAFAADPSDIRYLEKVIDLMLNAGDSDAALELLSRAIESAQDFMLADLLQLRASFVLREKIMDRDAMMQASSDLARALEQFISEDQERELQRTRVQVLIELRSLYQSDRNEDQERIVVRQLSDLLLAIGDQSASLDALVSWLRDHDSDQQIAEELGQKAEAVGDLTAAVFAYQKMAEASEDGEKIRALLLLADAAERANDTSTARSALEDALSLDSQNGAVLARLRAMYESSGAFSELAAILNDEAARQEEPSARFVLHVQVGDLMLNAGDPEAAVAAFFAAKALGVNNSLVIARLAQVYLASGESERARELLDEGIREHGKRRSPELARLQYGLSQVEAAAGNADGMFMWLEAALISDRNNVEIASELAIVAQEEGRYDTAIKALQNLALSKADGGMSKAEAYLRQAQIALIQGDEKKALLLARRAQSADSELPGLSDFLSQISG